MFLKIESCLCFVQSDKNLVLSIKMHLLVANLVVHLYYRNPFVNYVFNKNSRYPERCYEIKKYINPTNNEPVVTINNIVLTEYSFPPLPFNYEPVQDDLEFFLHSYIVNNNVLTKIEFSNYQGSKIFEDGSDIKLIIVSDMINDYQKFVVPTKYGANNEIFLNSLGEIPQDTRKNINNNMVAAAEFIEDFNFRNTAKTIELNHINLLEESVEFYKQFHQPTWDVVETIKEMLSSSRYTLSNDFRNNKLDLKDVQFQFEMMLSSNAISRNDILKEVFKIDDMISLI